MIKNFLVKLNNNNTSPFEEWIYSLKSFLFFFRDVRKKEKKKKKYLWKRNWKKKEFMGIRQKSSLNKCIRQWLQWIINGSIFTLQGYLQFPPGFCLAIKTPERNFKTLNRL